MTTLPVREMVLYKHGVGFFVREGKVTGDNVTLTFHQDEINDVLKSLTVFDKAGGQVLGIHYQTPMDKAARLANSSIHLSDYASLRELLRDLRGRQVGLTFESTPENVETVTGRVVGIDESGTDVINTSTVSLLTKDNQVRIFKLNTLRGVTIRDNQAEHDLQYFLDTSLSEDARRTVQVRLSKGQHQLAIHYVAPSPTWRVSYRVVAQSDENKQTGKALIQGWGLFDNRLEEDLDNVQVTLVAGQPISFIYELYASRIPVRPTVQDQSRIAPGPVEYEGISYDLDDPLGGMDPMAWLENLAARQGTNPEELTTSASLDMPRGTLKRATQITPKAMAASAPPPAQTKESGEFFQYVVTAPVSVKRGESALVPIIGAEVNYNRELLYNNRKLPNHPVAALRFKNTTGLTFERGPVTLVEDSDYKGEAVIPFTKDGTEVYLPYAVELGVRVTEQHDSITEIAGLTISGAYLIYEQFQINSVIYIIENTTAKPLTVTIEATIEPGYELFEMRAPDVETATDRRWRVEIPARGKTNFTRKQRQRTRRHEELRSLDYEKLHQFLEKRWLDKRVLQLLREMLDAIAQMQRLRTEQDKLTKERKTIYERQEQIRANLNTLQASKEEIAFRTRLLKQLEAAEDRIEEIDRRITQLTQELADAERLVNQIINGLGERQ